MSVTIYETDRFPTGIISITFSQGTEHGFHGVALTNEGSYCSCIGFQMRKTCAHIMAVVDYYSKSYNESELKKIYEVDSMVNMYRIPSSISYMNDFFGGIPRGILYGQYAPHNTSKTLTATQLFYDVLKFFKLSEKKVINGLFLDTEGSLATHYLTEWLPILNKRFDEKVGIILWTLSYEAYDADPKKRADITNFFQQEMILQGDSFIHVIDVDSLEKMLLLFGRPVVLEYSGKTTIKALPQWELYKAIQSVPLQKIITDYDIQYLAIDSFSQLLTAPFIGGNQNLPGRHDASMVLLLQAQKLARENKIVTIINMHPSKDPSNAKKPATHVGGKSVGHNFKFLVAHTEAGLSGKNKLASYRNVKVIRHPSKVNTKQKYMITDQGIEDFK